MPVLIKEKFYFEGLAGKISFSLTISVTKDGSFTAYYPPEAIEFLEKRFIETSYGRAGKKGYLSEKSLKEIKERVKKDFNDSLKCNPIKSYPVIKYKIKGIIYLVNPCRWLVLIPPCYGIIVTIPVGFVKSFFIECKKIT